MAQDAQGRSRLPQISDAEWEVMQVLWDHKGALTAGQVVEAVAKGRRWRPRTIKTLLNRLVHKGAVEVKLADPKRYLYRAKVARDAVVRQESRSFLSRVFGGEAAPAIVHFLEHHDLTPEELEQLRAILDREGRAS